MVENMVACYPLPFDLIYKILKLFPFILPRPLLVGLGVRSCDIVEQSNESLSVLWARELLGCW